MMKNGKDIFVEFLLNPKIRIVRHIALITFMFILALDMSLHQSLPDKMRIYSFSFFFLLFILISYLNVSVFVPKYLAKNLYSKYFISIFILSSITISIIAIIQLYYLDLTERMDELNIYLKVINIAYALIIIALVIVGLTSLMLFRYWIKDSIKAEELQSNTLKAELQLLKKQINPHFLFNMLNNANVLVKKDADEASKILYKLEDLLRYQLEDSSKEFVDLQTDIEFLNDFLNLEKVRRDNFEYLIVKNGDLNGIKLPPLLFITFVENAVKHNPDSDRTSYVNIKFELNNEILTFVCENSKPNIPIVKSKVGGIGLRNIKRRLELLFADKHTLEIEDTSLTYKVTLKLVV